MIRYPSLMVNCGYARVCIYANSDPNRRGPNARRNIDTESRSQKFLSQFGTLPTYGIPEEYFTVTPTSKNHCSQFDRHCNKILNGFQSKFNIGLSRDSYLTSFSLAKWSDLAQSEKEQHTLSRCKRCFEQHEAHQRYFPLKPVYCPEPVATVYRAEPVVTVDRAALQRQGVEAFTVNIVSELNRVYSDEAGLSFIDAVVQDRSLRLERKKTSCGSKKERRGVQREVSKKVRFTDSATIAVESNQRKSLDQLEEPPAAKRSKSHSPNFDKVAWDTERLRATLENWPRDTTINWSAIARSHGIAGGNAGQVVKEFAKAQNIDLSACTPKRKPAKRPCKKRVLGFGFNTSTNLQQSLLSGTSGQPSQSPLSGITSQPVTIGQSLLAGSSFSGTSEQLSKSPPSGISGQPSQSLLSGTSGQPSQSPLCGITSQSLCPGTIGQSLLSGQLLQSSLSGTSEQPSQSPPSGISGQLSQSCLSAISGQPSHSLLSGTSG